MHFACRLCAAAVCSVMLCAAGASAAPAPKRTSVKQPPAELAHSVHADMDFLAADEMHGRGSLTRDEHLAALYCASVFESLGLKPAGDDDSFLQQVPVTLSDRAKQRITRYEDVPRTSTWNAVAMLPGSDPALKGEVVLLTAHLDHLGVAAQPVNGDAIYNGADDDASGTTAVLNLARALAAGRAPRRTIVFALFGSEELGGYGARGFLEHPPVPLTSIVANLEFEMIGRPDPAVPAGTLWLTGYERSNLGPTLAAHGAHLLGDPHPDQHFFERSDNIQLARQGTIAQTVSSFGLHKDYHQVSDELKTIDFAHMITAIQSMEAPVRWLANTAWRPEWKPGGKPEPVTPRQ
ncbi:M20/M25/M40 family metallo-hydrolase [Terriglobus sp.]|uniref:M20/M25/M40 family metallo-hydrolase n=1 Tax=Terriglobus sp. TaxID=1889013 RepID=UPI003B0088A4